MAPWSLEDDDALKKLWPRFHPDEPQLLLSALGSRHSLEECRERYSQLLSHGDAGTRPRKVSFKLAKPILKTSRLAAKTPPSAPASCFPAKTTPSAPASRLAAKTTPSAPASCFPAKTTSLVPPGASSASCALVPPAWTLPQPQPSSSSSAPAPCCVFYARGKGICKKGQDCTFDHGQEPNRHHVYLVPPSQAASHPETGTVQTPKTSDKAKKPYKGMQDDLKSTENSRLSADSNRREALKRQLITEDVPRVKAGETDLERSIRRSKELTISYLFKDVKKL